MPTRDPNTEGSGFFLLVQFRISVQASGATSTNRSELKGSGASPDEAMVDSMLLCWATLIQVVATLEEKSFRGQ